MKENRSFRNLLAVGGATGSRLVGVLLLYALLARMLGPAKFGEFTYWYTIGIVLGALSDYGFAQQILIRLSVDTPERIKSEGERLLAAKLILVFIFFSIAIIFAIYDSIGGENLLWITPLLLACVCATMIEFFGVMLRARSQYQNEALRSFFATFAASVGAAIVGYLFNSLIIVCSVMLLGRLIVLYFQYIAAKDAINFENTFKLTFCISEPLRTLKHGFKYAADAGAGQLLSNIDVLIAKYFLSSESAGIYMAGNRLAQAALAGIPVLSNVFIPSLVSRYRSGVKASPPFLRGVVLFVSLSSFLIFFFGANTLPNIIFGPDFSALSALLPILGIVVALRYSLSLDAFYLAIKERQVDRALVQIILVFMSLSFATIFYGFNGLSGIKLTYVMAIIGAIQLSIYRLCVLRLK